MPTSALCIATPHIRRRGNWPYLFRTKAFGFLLLRSDLVWSDMVCHSIVWPACNIADADARAEETKNSFPQNGKQEVKQSEEK